LPYSLKKILTAHQIQLADSYTIENKSIYSIELMEGASHAFVVAIEHRISRNQNIIVVCGVGNNGGDGLAVARILQSKGFSVETILVKFKDKLSPDCFTNFHKLMDIDVVESTSEIPDFTNFDLIIDAIFGSGLTRPVEGLASNVINAINTAHKTVLSIDVPSGLYCDKLTDSDCIIKSALTVSFQRPKLSFFFPETNAYIQKWTVVNIGLNESFIQRMESENYVLDYHISSVVKTRKKFSHKGTYGHTLLIAGSHGKIGAVVLAAQACLRSGVGLLTTYVPRCGYEIIQVSTPEAMCLTDDNYSIVTALPDLSNYDSIGIGPGLGKHTLTKEVIKEIFSIANQGLVIDADALNIISEDKEILKILPKNSILTPHPKEFERLVGQWSNSEERLQKLKTFSTEHQCITVLKDANTCIGDQNGNVYFNTSGNSGMATGGSGDVLTGIITGVLAQGYDPLEAALIGVYFHGKSGNEAAGQKGKNALIASDLIDHLRIERE